MTSHALAKSDWSNKKWGHIVSKLSFFPKSIYI